MYETQIARGMDLLEGMVPDWIDRVDVGSLELNDCTDCVMGQLYGTFGRGLNVLGIAEAGDYGFNVPGEILDDMDSGSQELEYTRLTNEWIRAIEFRRGLDTLLENQYEQVLN